MYPGFRSALQRRVNADLLARFLRRRFANLADAVIVSTIPIVADLPERLHARRWVYYCVDDFSAWPGLDSQALRSMEQKFVAQADRIIAAGENLAGRMRSLGRESHVISHGIDLEHWRGGGQPTTLLKQFERPIVLFWGLIDRRLDLEALRALDQSMTVGTIALVGPQQDPDPGLHALARVKLTGPTSYENLPALAEEADVLIMPYADLPVTRAMQPLKLKEYLATGRPVVSTRLPALAGWDDCLDIADNPARFAAAVQLRSGSGPPGSQSAARERLQRESWKIKAGEFVKVLLGD
jgi:glycosyltransferase involved in cell wall biosynthesis